VRAMLRFAAPLCAALVPFGAAGALGAGAPKPSQLATVRAVSTVCPFPTAIGNNAFVLDSASTPGGVQAPFVIPPKQVFVITSANLRLSGGPANETAQLFLLAGPGPESAVLTEGVTTTNADGLANIDRILPSGIAVRSGLTLCVTGTQGNTLGSVTGYFAKDK
jgi:hypothetical protein